MRSSSTRKLLWAAPLLLAACASSAPPLPVDTTAVNRQRDLTEADFTPEALALSCGQIAEEQAQLRDAMAKANQAIADNRTRNQVAGYFAALLIVPIVAVKGNVAERDSIAKAQERRDQLVQLTRFKSCPTAQG